MKRDSSSFHCGHSRQRYHGHIAVRCGSRPCASNDDMRLRAVLPGRSCRRHPFASGQKSVRYQDGYRGVDGARLNDIVEEPMAAIDSPSPPLYQRLTLDRDVEFPSGNDQCLFTCASCYKLPLCSLADFDRAETIGERMYLHFNKCFSVDGSGFCL